MGCFPQGEVGPSGLPGPPGVPGATVSHTSLGECYIITTLVDKISASCLYSNTVCVIISHRRALVGSVSEAALFNDYRVRLADQVAMEQLERQDQV